MLYEVLRLRVTKIKLYFSKIIISILFKNKIRKVFAE